MHTITIQGEIKKHKVLLYAISTCPWCKKAKELLKDNKIEVKYVDADLCKRINHNYKTNSNKIPLDIDKTPRFTSSNLFYRIIKHLGTTVFYFLKLFNSMSLRKLVTT